MTDGRWTLDELVAEVAVRLAATGHDVPDRRTVRYYTTLGLVAGPREFRGKVGLYGELQVLQLLAIKHLQAQGEPLDVIQSRLLGLSIRRLRAIADRDPAPVVQSEPVVQAPAVLQGVTVSDALTVMVKAKRTVMPEDVEAIEAACAPLVRLLRARRLIE